MKLTEHALDVLDSIENWQAAIRRINTSIKALDPDDDFCTHLQMMPSSLEGKIVELLDSVLGGEIASYYLYEASNMNGGGSITEKDGSKYPIRNIGDVKRYIEAALIHPKGD